MRDSNSWLHWQKTKSQRRPGASLFLCYNFCMLFSADVANLLLYCAQQLGVTLGVGAETIMLAAYLISMRDGVVDEKEGQYARAIKRVMNAALFLIILSGLGITFLHAAAGESATIGTPAYLFKSLLIVLAIALTLLRHKFSTSSVVEGVIGATWYALFLVHILAPVTGWFNLFTLYAVWLAGFVLCWEALVLMRKDKKTAIKKVAPSVPKKEEPNILEEAPAPAAMAPKPTIVLAPDIPKVTPAPPPVPPAAPAKVEKITTIRVSPVGSVAPSPATKVTDTPFLPAVPALQPIPTMPDATAPPAPVAAPAPSLVASMPSPAPVPLEQEGLSAMNIMPKAPTDTKK